MWKLVIGGIVIGTVSYGVIKYFAGGVCNCKARLDGLVIIITGANSGIGKALSKELAKRGATLILACRDIQKGIDLKQEIINSGYLNVFQIYVKSLDLNSFDSIYKFSQSINEEFHEIYALVNNAGVFYHPQKLTKDKFDVTYQTNYLGPFILTHYLLKILKRSEHSRIINVTSEAHRNVNVYDLKAVSNCQAEFRSHFTAYGVSKLGVLLFTKELAKKLKCTNIIVNAANPGNVETPIYRNFPPLSNPWLFALQWPIRKIVVKSPIQGAQTILHSLLTSNRSTGQYYSDCKLCLPSPIALDDHLSREYYEFTLELLGNKFLTESEC
ncbi:retinol dehydrogenase 12-like [Onthophagus taurus]|uniref:retinol dehydrogenase 12-like n=1 Tax=Onthophagus taurus TaxID=166361 RepID=UPI000C20F636|nr:retinol dehydrogenase 12-like [Onthophagus taurus]